MKKLRHKTGIQEWADVSVNSFQGCKNSCLYCWAKELAWRYNRIRSRADWQVMKPLKSLKVVKNKGVVMYPSTHDIFKEHLGTHIYHIRQLLKNGNQVLVVSKARPDAIIPLATKFIKDPYKDKIEFRITIGSANDQVLSFWEPQAPSYKDRRICLEYVGHLGFKNSVSIEPMLDFDTMGLQSLVEDLLPFVNGEIWLGFLRKFEQRVDLSGLSDEQRLNVVTKYRNYTTPKVAQVIKSLYGKYPNIKYKESFRELEQRGRC